MQSAALKEALDDLEWPGSSIEITVSPVPPIVTFRGEGHGDLQVRVLSQITICNLYRLFAISVSSFAFDVPL